MDINPNLIVEWRCFIRILGYGEYRVTSDEPRTLEDEFWEACNKLCVPSELWGLENFTLEDATPPEAPMEFFFQQKVARPPALHEEDAADLIRPA